MLPEPPEGFLCSKFLVTSMPATLELARQRGSQVAHHWRLGAGGGAHRDSNDRTVGAEALDAGHADRFEQDGCDIGQRRHLGGHPLDHGHGVVELGGVGDRHVDGSQRPVTALVADAQHGAVGNGPDAFLLRRATSSIAA